MIEGSVEGLTGLLEAIAGWGEALWITLREPAETLGGYVWGGLVTFAANPIFPAATALLGAVTGAFVNQSAVDKREKAKAEKEAEAVRTLLRLEIDHNLDEIKSLAYSARCLVKYVEEDLPPTLNRSPQESEDCAERIRGFDKGIRRCINYTQLNKKAFDSLISDIPKALSNKETERTLVHYTEVDLLRKAIKVFISQKFGWSEAKHYNKSSDHFDKVDWLLLSADSALDKGNPLAGPT